MQPALGRVFTEDEDDKGVRVVVMSHGLWQRRFGGASDIVGRKISVNDEAYEVIGVMPQTFLLHAVARHRHVDASVVSSQLAKEFHLARCSDRGTPQARSQTGTCKAIHGRPELAGDGEGLPRAALGDRDPSAGRNGGQTGPALIVLLWAAAALLLIACVNLANLLLSRGEARGREVAVRAALGAGRGRLFAQFLTESLVLAGLGAVAGLWLALPAMRFLEQLVPEAMGAARLTLDWRVLAFATVIAVAAALAFGLAPAWRGSRLTPQEGLRDGGRGMPARAAIGSNIHSSWSRRRSPSRC